MLFLTSRLTSSTVIKVAPGCSYRNAKHKSRMWITPIKTGLNELSAWKAKEAYDFSVLHMNREIQRICNTCASVKGEQGEWVIV